MTRRPAPALAAVVGLLALAPAAGAASVISIGAGAATTGGGGDFNASTPDSGERLNVHARRGQTLPAGTYDMISSAVDSAGLTGAIVPFLATLTDDAARAYRTVQVGPPTEVSTRGIYLKRYPEGAYRFTLTEPTVVYAGVYTTGGGRVDYLAGGVTDHQGGTFGEPGGPQGPTAGGQAVGSFSNPGLDRTYAFEVAVMEVPEPGALGLLGVAAVALGRPRRGRATPRST